MACEMIMTRSKTARRAKELIDLAVDSYYAGEYEQTCNILRSSYVRHWRQRDYLDHLNRKRDDYEKLLQQQATGFLEIIEHNSDLFSRKEVLDYAIEQMSTFLEHHDELAPGVRETFINSIDKIIDLQPCNFDRHNFEVAIRGYKSLLPVIIHVVENHPERFRNNILEQMGSEFETALLSFAETAGMEHDEYGAWSSDNSRKLPKFKMMLEDTLALYKACSDKKLLPAPNKETESYEYGFSWLLDWVFFFIDYNEDLDDSSELSSDGVDDALETLTRFLIRNDRVQVYYEDVRINVFEQLDTDRRDRNILLYPVCWALVKEMPFWYWYDINHNDWKESTPGRATAVTRAFGPGRTHACWQIYHIYPFWAELVHLLLFDLHEREYEGGQVRFSIYDAKAAGYWPDSTFFCDATLIILHHIYVNGGFSPDQLARFEYGVFGSWLKQVCQELIPIFDAIDEASYTLLRVDNGSMALALSPYPAPEQAVATATTIHKVYTRQRLQLWERGRLFIDSRVSCGYDIQGMEVEDNDSFYEELFDSSEEESCFEEDPAAPPPH
jgi:hypothetical protein